MIKKKKQIRVKCQYLAFLTRVLISFPVKRTRRLV